MMYKDWFKHWFNSEHYFLLYQNRNEEEAEKFLNLIEKNIPLKKEWRILDFCCGSGRLSKVIAKRGYRVTGIDLSEFFINKAKEIFRSEDLSGDFRICDVRTFNENEVYNLGINFFTSFGYFSDEENKLTLKHFCNSITKNGWIVLDFLNPEYVKNNLIERELFEYKFSEIRIERSLENRRINKLIVIKSREKEERFFESVQLYDLNDFETMFHQNGFRIQKTFGDYSGSFFDLNSPRMIIFSQKI